MKGGKRDRFGVWMFLFSLPYFPHSSYEFGPFWSCYLVFSITHAHCLLCVLLKRTIKRRMLTSLLTRGALDTVSLQAWCLFEQAHLVSCVPVAVLSNTARILCSNRWICLFALPSTVRKTTAHSSSPSFYEVPTTTTRDSYVFRKKIGKASLHAIRCHLYLPLSY